jgi:hypothetical protein
MDILRRPTGSVRLDPCYTFGKPIQQTIAIGGEKKMRAFPNPDHFGGERAYFSDCVLRDKQPEPSGEAGFADVRVLEAILQALDSGGSVKLEPFTRSRRIDTEEQKMVLSAVSTPELVHASSPALGEEKKPKN